LWATLRAVRSEAELAWLVVQVARAVQAGVVLCTTETAAFPRYLHQLSDQLRVVAAATIVISATDGNVRIFSDGKLVLQIDPTVAYGPITLENFGTGE